jgi:hypothetical protein
MKTLGSEIAIVVVGIPDSSKKLNHSMDEK